MQLSKRAIREFIALSHDPKLREDFSRQYSLRHNNFMVNNKVDIDRWIEFLNSYNEFINHTPKPFKQIVDTVSRL